MDSNKGVDPDFLRAIRERVSDHAASDNASAWTVRQEVASADDLSPGALIDRWNKLTRG